MRFSDEYGRIRTQQAVRERPGGRERRPNVSEEVVQCVWYDQLFRADGLCAADGCTLSVESPGWWNHTEGPDFKNARIALDGRALIGDIEVHLTHDAWRQHGHHLDPRYDSVVLVVTLESEAPRQPPTTSAGRPLPVLLLSRFLDDDLSELTDKVVVDDYPYEASGAYGYCAGLAEAYGTEQLFRLLTLAGEWRLLNKARGLRERADRVGMNQALYEAFMYACGFSSFKHHFRMMAQQLPYERVRQLAQRDPLLVETAFLQLGGLLPDALPGEADSAPHLARLQTLRGDALRGLKSLPVTWKRTSVRPTNYPERRLAGAARFLVRTAQDGLADCLERIWKDSLSIVARRRAFEALFPRPMGFWGDHCTWTGKKLTKPASPLGPDRVRSIIGNVFVPAALAVARHHRDREGEERVFEFFAALPKEADNHIVKAMIPRVFGENKAKLNFHAQQGLLQVFQDWCEPNPSCSQCGILPFLDVGPPRSAHASSERNG